MRCFVLTAIDDALDMSLFETRFVVDRIEQLRTILGDCASDDPEMGHINFVDEDDISAINAAFGIAYMSHGRETMLAPWHVTRSAPYLIHTGLELPLMLEGRKPMAVFSDAYPADWLDLAEQRFEPYVSEGRIARRIHDEPFSPREHISLRERFAFRRRLYFFLPGKDWRVDVHIWLHGFLSTGIWHDLMERTEGSLLGYSDEQNDWWIAFRRDRLGRSERALGGASGAP